MADTAVRSEQGNQLGSSKELHTSFGFIIMLMLTLVVLKYQRSGTNLFKEHRLAVFVFTMFVLVYGIALVRMTLDDDGHNSNSVPTNYTSSSLHAYTYILIISGTLACELLLYVLVTPLVWFLIIVNAFAFIFAVVLRRSCHQQISEPSLPVSSSDDVADRDLVHKLHEWIKQVILCRQSAPLDHTTHEEHDRTERNPSAYLGFNRMHGLFKQISNSLCSAPATTSVEDEGRRDVQMSEIV